MGTRNLHRLFNPVSAAIIGASEKKGSIGRILMKNMILNGFSGREGSLAAQHFAADTSCQD